MNSHVVCLGDSLDKETVMVEKSIIFTATILISTLLLIVSFGLTIMPIGD